MKKLLSVFLFVGFSVSAQITITSSDIPHNVSDWIVRTADSVDLLDVGHEGGPQHWEFQLVHPGMVETTYVRPVGDSPILDSFPGTNLLWVTSVVSDTGGKHYAHYNLSSSSLLGLGCAVAMDTPLIITASVYHPPSIELEFPANYGSAWTSNFSYTMGLDSSTNSYTVIAKQTEHLIDAWGTVTTPMGTFNTLRHRSIINTITDTYIFGMLIWSDTSNAVAFNWLVNNYGPIVSVTADSVSQDTLLATPWCYWLMTQGTVRVEEDQPHSDSKLSNVKVLGNPTSLPLQIELGIEQSEKAIVEIYDVSGRLIGRFRDVTAGLFTWNGITLKGCKVPSGIYMVKVKTSSGTKSFNVSIM